MPQQTILIIAGELSGDIHAADLMRELHQQDPSIDFVGTGGDKMLAEGLSSLAHIKEMACMGITEVLANYRILSAILRRTKQYLQQQKPDLVILIDYPGFNLRMARYAKKSGIPVLYYITPKLWAWGKWRMKTMQTCVNHAAVIFPFEQTLFQNAGVPSTYVGNPLMQQLDIKAKDHLIEQMQLNQHKSVIGLLPGSRAQEVSALLPIFLDTIALLKAEGADIQVVLSQAPGIADELIQALLTLHPQLEVMVWPNSHDVMQVSDVLLIASGTASLEAALYGTPMVITYTVSRLTAICYRCISKIDWAGLPNILAKRQIVPECLQKEANPQRLMQEVLHLLADPSTMKKDLAEVKAMLENNQKQSVQTAKIAMQLLETSILTTSQG